MRTSEQPHAAEARAETKAAQRITLGRNGVAIDASLAGKSTGAGFRTYEVHQRERVGESTHLIKPAQLNSPDYQRDPYPLLEILRENYPCFRDWLNNAYWITQYNDVTSIFQDDANFESRSRRWYYNIEDFGRDLRFEIPVLYAHANALDNNAQSVAEDIINSFVKDGQTDLATEFCARYPLELLTKALDLPRADFETFVTDYWAMVHGYDWEPQAEQAGLQAKDRLVAYFKPIVAARRKNPGDDMISAMVQLDLPDGPVTAADVVATLMEMDHQTLHGGLANMWYLLLTHPDQLHKVSSERRWVKFAWLETLRHSTPVLSAKRYTIHEVERFGRLLPEGSVIICSAAAANRDPRIYHDPDSFIVGRKDLCQREPRGHYRADGLAAGVAFGLGKPSKHPAVPEDRPRSLYALTRDTAVTASKVLLDRLPNLRLHDDARPTLRSLRVGDMHTCWSLPVEFGG